MVAGHQRGENSRQTLVLERPRLDEAVDQPQVHDEAVLAVVQHERRGDPGRPRAGRCREAAQVPRRYPARDLHAAPALLRRGHLSRRPTTGVPAAGRTCVGGARLFSAVDRPPRTMRKAALRHFGCCNGSGAFPAMMMPSSLGRRYASCAATTASPHQSWACYTSRKTDAVAPSATILSTTLRASDKRGEDPAVRRAAPVGRKGVDVLAAGRP